MGIENQPFSINAVLDGINSGEIKSGYKGTEPIAISKELTGFYNKEEKVFTLTENGVTTKIVIEDGEIIQIELMDARTGNHHNDTELELVKKEKLQYLINQGVIPT